MPSSEELRRTLNRIDGQGYRAYRDIGGCYDFGEYSLSIDHVQGDPFAAPSRLSVRLGIEKTGFGGELVASRIRRTALSDFLTRAFQKGIDDVVRGHRGSGHSGLFQIDVGAQEVLESNSVVLESATLEARFTVGLPASGRRILGKQAEDMLFLELPQIVRQSLFRRSLPAEKLDQHLKVVEDQDSLRNQLRENGLLAFVANGSLLPRKSGVDDRPLTAQQSDRVVPFRVVSFQSPPDLEIELHRPNLGPLRGMGLRPGVTLIVGGGFHGKSTLLRALERGVYNHIPGDGREGVVTIESAVKVRAEDGRSVERVDLSPFIGSLPLGKSTTSFSTENASGSTSQAANILEALEVGTQLLLVDEDTSATNFIIRDGRMQSLVDKAREPITPFVDKVQQLARGEQTSIILVMGGSGDYFDVADTVIMMDQYQPIDVTSRARKIVETQPSQRESEGGTEFGRIPRRVPLKAGFDPSRGNREVRIDSKGLGHILFGTTSIDLSALEQLVDPSQTRAIGEAIHYYSIHYVQEGLSLREGLQRLMEDLEKSGLDVLSRSKVGNLAKPRLFEIAFAINRMRSLRVSA